MLRCISGVQLPDWDRCTGVSILVYGFFYVLVYGCCEMYGFATLQMYGCILFLWHLPYSCVWGTKRKIVYLLFVLSVASRHVIKILVENAMFVISCRFTIFSKRDKLEQ